MPGLGKSGNKAAKKTKRDDGKVLTRTDEEIRPEAPCPFSVDLIRKVIFSHLENEDLLRARLVAKNWSSLATEEFRGRKTIFPWIPRGGEPTSALDEESAVGFMDVMTLSLPLIPVQRVGLRLDLLSIQPSTLLHLLIFIAPWVKAVTLVPWSSDIEKGSCDGLVKAMAWSSALHSFPPLDFPRLEALNLGVEDEGYKRLHDSIAMSLANLMTKVVEGAKSLEKLSYSALFFGDDEELEDAEREATKSILSALPTSLTSLSFGYNCAVDYGSLTALHLNLEEFFCDGQPDPEQAFMEFLEGQKTGLKLLHFVNLKDIYDSHFPNFPLVTELEMSPKQSATFKCLTAFPVLLTLRVHMGLDYPPDTSGPSDISHLPAHQGVRKLVLRLLICERLHIGFTFPLFGHVLPNLTHVDFDCRDKRDLTPLFTHLPRLASLKLLLNYTRDFEGMESILTGLHSSVLEMAKDFDVLDAEAFYAMEVIGSRKGNSTVGLGNMKDLQVLDISSKFPNEYYAGFLSKLTFGTVFLKLRSLKEIRIARELPQPCEPIAEALGNKGIHVRVYEVKE